MSTMGSATPMMSSGWPPHTACVCGQGDEAGTGETTMPLIGSGWPLHPACDPWPYSNPLHSLHLQDPGDGCCCQHVQDGERAVRLLGELLPECKCRKGRCKEDVQGRGEDSAVKWKVRGCCLGEQLVERVRHACGGSRLLPTFPWTWELMN